MPDLAHRPAHYDGSPAVDPDGQQPHLSMVMPAYNEEETVAYTVRRLVHAFEQAGHRLQLVVVDNGSHDRTGEIIRELAAELRNALAADLAAFSVEPG